MMPFYHIWKTHSVPGYLKLRFGPGSQALSSISFAFMTVLMSGINMYAMAVVMRVVLGWDIHFSIWVSSITVADLRCSWRLAFGDLQRGSAVFSHLGGRAADADSGSGRGWWLDWPEGPDPAESYRTKRANPAHTCMLWCTLGNFNYNPMGIHWVGIVFGLGAVISIGYWTTDFLVVQRVLPPKDLRSAKLAPIIGAAFKMLVPFIVILPGLLGLGVVARSHTCSLLRLVPGVWSTWVGPAQLQRSAAADAGALLWARTARSWHHRADCRVYVGHGRQRQRLRHRVDL